MVTVFQEYLIYDEISMIGSIGGSLGMCIGFSITNALSFVLNYIQNCFGTERNQTEPDEPRQTQMDPDRPEWPREGLGKNELPPLEGKHTGEAFVKVHSI